MRYWTLLIFFLGCFCCFSISPKDSLTVQKDTTLLVQKTITASQLEGFRNNPDFNYEEIKKSAPDWWIAFKNWIYSIFLRLFESLFGVEKAVGTFASFLEVLPYILLLLLVFILIKFFLHVNARALVHTKKNHALADISEEEHIVKNEDIPTLIKKATDQNNYRLAIRYYYLYMLQLLSDKELIAWELQKTNEDYRKELKKKELIAPFAKSTLLYDYFWYGEFPIDETRYLKAEASFLSLKDLLKNG